MTKILFITLFPIETNNSSMITNLSILKGLYELNYDITVVSPYANKLNMYYDDNRKVMYNQRIYLGDCKSNVIKKENTNKYNILRKLWYKVSYFDKSIKYFKDASRLNLDSFYDIIISFSDPKSSHIFGKKLSKRIKYNKWIQLWGDPLTLDITKTVIWPDYVTRKIEEYIISKSDKIVYVSPFTCLEQKKLYPNNSHKMTFIPLPFYEEKKFCKKNNTYTIGYFGDYTSKIRNIKPLYNAITKSNYKLIIAGSSDVALEPKNNIEIKGRITTKDLDIIMKDLDILISLCNLSGSQIPGKIYYDSATDIPILIILDGELKEDIKKYFSNYHRYYFCENDEDSILNTIDIIYNENKKFSPCKEFNYLNITKRVLE